MNLPSLFAALRQILAALGFVSPPRRRRRAHQVAALPVKTTPGGKVKVLLISTRGNPGKLIIPRGWPMNGRADCQAAQIEAEEEAGVLGQVSLDPVGSYLYRSGRKAGGRPVHVDVYRLDVVRRAPRFKERGQRRLLWLDVAEAAARVNEPGLVPIIEALSPRPVGPDEGFA